MMQIMQAGAIAASVRNRRRASSRPSGALGGCTVVRLYGCRCPRAAILPGQDLLIFFVTDDGKKGSMTARAFKTAAVLQPPRACSCEGRTRPPRGGGGGGRVPRGGPAMHPESTSPEVHGVRRPLLPQVPGRHHARSRLRRFRNPPAHAVARGARARGGRTARTCCSGTTAATFGCTFHPDRAVAAVRALQSAPLGARRAPPAKYSQILHARRHNC